MIGSWRGFTRLVFLCIPVWFAAACTTVPSGDADNETELTQPNFPDPDVENPGVIIIAEPAPIPPPAIPAPPPPVTDPPIEELVEATTWYGSMRGWNLADPLPALLAFSRTCESFQKADPEAWLNTNLPQYGQYKDWLPACTHLTGLDMTAKQGRHFFETEFVPLRLRTGQVKSGQLTGYYEPEIAVRKTPDADFSEPVLAKPDDGATQNLPRAQINAASARVIAYGRPMDVFFMQIQGSGRIRFLDGQVLRAAYGGNNGHDYVSIGKLLVARGEMELSQASKQSIEVWMEQAGPEKARALMNENPRYIFFQDQEIGEGEGPRGAMRLPLTAMGSIAVDPRYHPYGAVVFLSTKIPQEGGDYNGKTQGLLVVAQDTGNAIRGALRADLFFGSGAAAGAKAGVMNHDAEWVVLVPKSLAESGPVS